MSRALEKNKRPTHRHHDDQRRTTVTVPGGQRRFLARLGYVTARGFLAYTLEDSTASAVFLMFPRMRLSRLLALWLALLIFRRPRHETQSALVAEPAIR